MPGWLSPPQAQSPEDTAFLAGAALAHLHAVRDVAAVPQPLWRERLALEAPVACVKFAGRREGAGALRDTVHRLRPGDHPGPNGEIFGQWREAAARPLSAAAVGRVLPDGSPARIGDSPEAGGNPVARAACILEAVLAEASRAETTALILADAALARSLG